MFLVDYMEGRQTPLLFIITPPETECTTYGRTDVVLFRGQSQDSGNKVPMEVLV